MNIKNKKAAIWASVVSGFVAICVIFCAIYVNDYYKADLSLDAYSPSQSITVKQVDQNVRAYVPQKARAGLIFYPGGKVEYSAYEPLMQACAEKGILCVIAKMPFNLAVLDVNAADGMQQMFPEIKSWYIGGHSLGGSMAASYISKNVNEYEGLILLASYSTADISKSGLKVLSIFGSEDKVLDAEKYQKYKSNLPDDLTEFVIDGGNHAYFGMYGEQDGDGNANISNVEQIKFTADRIDNFIK